MDRGRRSALKLLAAAAPAVAVLGGAVSAAEDQPEEPKAEKPRLSDDARFIVKHEPGLTGDERRRLTKQLPGFEKALGRIRDFDLPDDVEPALTFRALRARRENR